MEPKEDLCPKLVTDLALPKQLIDVSWLPSLTREWSEIGKALQASTTIPDFSKLDLEGSVRDGFRTMALRGWTVQTNLTPRDLAELADKTPEEADEFFVALYTEDDFAELRKVRKEFAYRPGLAQWQALLEECFESFEKGHYLITIPALLSVIEGVVASAGQALTKHRVPLRNICAEKSEKSGSNFMRAEMWTSMALFVEKLFQPAPFDNARPPFMNRHWILHGRDSASWTQADALRLFNALQTVDSLLE
jgi:hypothetical protein